MAKQKSSANDLVPFASRVPKALRTRLKTYSAKANVTVTAILAEALEAYLKRKS